MSGWRPEEGGGKGGGGAWGEGVASGGPGAVFTAGTSAATGLQSLRPH